MPRQTKAQKEQLAKENAPAETADAPNQPAPELDEYTQQVRASAAAELLEMQQASALRVAKVVQQAQEAQANRRDK